MMLFPHNFFFLECNNDTVDITYGNLLVLHKLYMFIEG